MSILKTFFLFFILFTGSIVFAKIDAYDYSINYWFLGKIGNASISIDKNSSHYQMKGVAAPIGFAAMVSDNHKEIHTSRGIINNHGLFIPHYYRMLKTKNDYVRDINFTFNHKKQKIIVSYYEEKNISKSHFSFKTMRFETAKTPEVKRKHGTLTFYATNDLLSMFYNIRFIKPSLHPKKSYTLSVVGSESPEGELVLMMVPDKNESFVSYTGLPTTLSVTLSQGIFEDSQGQLYVAIDEDNISKEFVMEDVMLFGDVRVILEK